ncbi:hypothetical protein T4D_10005 [Trichinella pseudospiralis]|uniref:Secreted protein n=1 Tax=Trichinella pseudospiralis TaxID=6337 RepID=A0A0V1F831_TRIPS|nr:hypothetical protein T4D_10005 [Trichinella pseudospiralis]
MGIYLPMYTAALVLPICVLQQDQPELKSNNNWVTHSHIIIAAYCLSASENWLRASVKVELNVVHCRFQQQQRISNASRQRTLKSQANENQADDDRFTDACLNLDGTRQGKPDWAWSVFNRPACTLKRQRWLSNTRLKISRKTHIHIHRHRHRQTSRGRFVKLNLDQEMRCELCDVH